MQTHIGKFPEKVDKKILILVENINPKGTEISIHNNTFTHIYLKVQVSEWK